MRQPRALIKVNGEILQAWKCWDVHSTGLYTADTFRLELALSGQPADRGWLWWANQQVLQVEILAGFPADPTNYDSTNLTSMVLGNTDLIETDPVTGIITLSGRDLTAPMIDTKTDNKYQNQTSSQIVTQIAEAQGLTPNVTATTTKVGVYYNIDHVVPTTERSIWDLLTYLAQREGFQIGVRGKTLNFGPRSPDTSPFLITWDDSAPIATAEAKTLRFSHNLTLARDVVVKVRSWNMWYGQAYTKTATLKHTRGSAGEPQVYSYVIPGLSPDQAQQKAQNLAASISQHELRMAMDLPGDVTPTTADSIQLRGTPYDQIFYPDSIARSMEMPEEGGETESSGFRMTIEAKNTLPASMVLL